MTIQYQFHFTPYRYSFNQPLRTSHGIWRVREGIIITLRDPRKRSSGMGEVLTGSFSAPSQRLNVISPIPARRGSGSPEARLRRPLRGLAKRGTSWSAEGWRYAPREADLFEIALSLSHGSSSGASTLF